MKRIVEGRISGEGFRFSLIVSRFNHFITDRLLEGSLDALIRHGARQEDIEIIKVPGAFEIPPVARKVARNKKSDAIICLGTIIRGDTPHFEYISSEVAKGIALVALESEIPVIFGVITADNLEQAIERAGTKGGNKGWEAAVAAMEMVNLYKALEI